jgi:KDO2-lipid IV(A) lauroyltransferase
MKKIRYFFETMAVYGIYGFFKLFPLERASSLGGAIMRALGPHLGISRVAARHIALALPEKSAQEQSAILHDMWDNLGRVVAEYPHLHDIHKNVEVVGGEYLTDARDSGKPALFFAAHIGNWEVCAIAARMHGLPMHLVYRRPNNLGVDGLLRHARDSGGAGHIAKGPAGAREILFALKNNQSVGILMDQKLSEGMAVPFFDRDAMTAPAIAHFALKFGCPVHPAVVERLNGARFRVTISPALDIRPTGDKDEDTRQILLQINRQIEVWVRKNPGQWLWLHRRWG